MNDTPRYRILYNVFSDQVEPRLKQVLRVGDRVVSIYPAGHTFTGEIVNILLELRHPSWERDGFGFTATDNG